MEGVFGLHIRDRFLRGETTVFIYTYMYVNEERLNLNGKRGPFRPEILHNIQYGVYSFSSTMEVCIIEIPPWLNYGGMYY
jgi:hypothetical protein